ncbi:transposase-like protein [Bradyrhizobium sp. JR3.5]
MDEVFPGTRRQRCWQHKTVNVLNKVPSSVQSGMKKALQDISMAPSRAAAELALEAFAEKYSAKYARAVDCLVKDREDLLAFYDFPALGPLANHQSDRKRVRQVRHRTVRTKGSLSPQTARLMVFKLIDAASKTWRRLKGTNQLPKIIAGVRFADGIEVIPTQQSHAA